MKRVLLLFVVSLFLGRGHAQTINCDFESDVYPPEGYFNGADGTNTFYYGALEFPVEYDTSFGGFWSSGFALSVMTDDTTGNYTNLYSSITGSGAGGSDWYAVGNLGAGPIEINWSIPLSGSIHFLSAQVSNTTYAYYSMLQGDAFAKKFGGTTGDDPDYFFLRIGTGDFSDDSDPQNTDVYLADFRFSNNTQDYIEDEWVDVDLSITSANAGPLKCELFSSDTSAFGMNTPAFFCIDNIQYDLTVGVDETGKESSVTVVQRGDGFSLQTTEVGDYRVIDLRGRELMVVQRQRDITLQHADFPAGVYIVQYSSGDVRWESKFFIP